MSDIDDQKQGKSKEKRVEDDKQKRPAWLVYLLSIFSMLYLLNPTAGLIEIIPDNIPFIGNLDEGVAAVLVWEGINQLRNVIKSRPKKHSSD